MSPLTVLDARSAADLPACPFATLEKGQIVGEGDSEHFGQFIKSEAPQQRGACLARDAKSEITASANIPIVFFPMVINVAPTAPTP